MADNWNHCFPSELVHHVTAICGPRGEAWLDGLPALIDELSEIWSIKVDEPFAAGEFNFVAPAMSGGEAVVLKIAPPYDDNEFLGEASFLRSREGLGAVRLLAQDLMRRAILIDRAVPGENLAEIFTGNAAASMPPASEVCRSILGPTSADRADLKTVDGWCDGRHRSAGTDFPADYANKALASYDQRRATEVFSLHGDFHPANIVSASRSPYLAID